MTNVRGPVTWIASIWQDMRHAARLASRSPGLAAAAIVTLALGIGANTAIFSLIDATLLHPLAVSEPDRLVSFRQHIADVPVPSDGFLYTDYQAFRDRLRSFQGLAVQGGRPVGLGDNDGTRRAEVLFVSANYFDVVGVRPHTGRWFSPEEEREAAPRVVLTYAAWQRWFGGDPHVVGRLLRLTGVPATIVGVAPRGFKGTDLAQAVDVFVPVASAVTVASMKENFFSDKTVDNGDGLFSPSKWLRIVGRLKAGVTRESAEAELRVFAGRSGVRSITIGGFSLLPAAEAALPVRARTSNVKFAWVLASVVALVLLVGCTGLAGLLLAQGEKRRPEFATRLALGAPRSRLLRQLLTETGVLVAIGSACGLAMSRAMLVALADFDLPGRLAIADLDPHVTRWVLAFTVGCAVVTGLVAGVVPAWRASIGRDVASGLKNAGRTTGNGRTRLQAGMLAVQVALTTVLLVGAGLFVRSVQAGFTMEFGFRPERLVSIDLNPRLRRYDRQQATALVEQLTERLKRLPGVEAVAVGSTSLSTPSLSGPTVWADGQRRRVQPYLEFRFVDREYFRTLGIRLQRGRVFTVDDRQGSSPVAVINEALARAAWGDMGPLGRRVTRLPVSGPNIVAQAEIVGVVANARTGLVDGGTPALYLLRDQNPIFNRDATTITVRVARDPRLFVPLLRQQVRAVDRDLPVTAITTAEEQIARVLAVQRMGAWLTGWFSVLALSLALVGSYGIVAYAVSCRTPEIGLRVALGASPSRMPLVMLRSALAPVIAGSLAGLAAAWPCARLIRSFLFGVPPQDPLSFAAAALLLILAASLAGYLAARRASLVDPVDALRAE